MSGVYLIFINICLSTEIIQRERLCKIMQRERLCYLTSGTYFVEMFLSIILSVYPPQQGAQTGTRKFFLELTIILAWVQSLIPYP